MHSPDESIIESARRILDEEARAILRRGASLGSAFVGFVEKLLSTQGMVVVTGVGKSGIIGEKIAATFASTGTPAIFLHPVDALHGDLGIVSPRDVILAISNSGETSEVLAVVSAAQGLGVPVLAMTGAAESTLARKADGVLDIGVEREACPLGLAPTASTTVTLAMGDALAMVLLEERRFTREHYLRFHPGGSLGERLRFRVRDLMRQGERIPRVQEDAPLSAALEEMTRRENIGLTLVLSAGGALAGIITDGDVRRVLLLEEDREAVIRRPVGEVMTRTPRTIDPEASAAEALRIMEVHGITSLAVVGLRGQPEGLLHLHDILGRGKVLL